MGCILRCSLFSFSSKTTVFFALLRPCRYATSDALDAAREGAESCSREIFQDDSEGNARRDSNVCPNPLSAM